MLRHYLVNKSTSLLTNSPFQPPLHIYVVPPYLLSQEPPHLVLQSTCIHIDTVTLHNLGEGVVGRVFLFACMYICTYIHVHPYTRNAHDAHSRKCIHVYSHIFWQMRRNQNGALCMYDDGGNVAYNFSTICSVVPCTVQTITIIIDPSGTPEVPSKVPTPPSFQVSETARPSKTLEYSHSG